MGGVITMASCSSVGHGHRPGRCAPRRWRQYRRRGAVSTTTFVFQIVAKSSADDASEEVVRSAQRETGPGDKTFGVGNGRGSQATGRAQNSGASDRAIDWPIACLRSLAIGLSRGSSSTAVGGSGRQVIWTLNDESARGHRVDTRQPQRRSSLARGLNFQRISLEQARVHRVSPNVREVGCCRQEIVGKAQAVRIWLFLVVLKLFHERPAEALHDRAQSLAIGDQRVEHAADVPRRQ